MECSLSQNGDGVACLLHHPHYTAQHLTQTERARTVSVCVCECLYIYSTYVCVCVCVCVYDVPCMMCMCVNDRGFPSVVTMST